MSMKLGDKINCPISQRLWTILDLVDHIRCKTAVKLGLYWVDGDVVGDVDPGRHSLCSFVTKLID